MREDAIPFYAYFAFSLVVGCAFYVFMWKGWPRLKRAIHPWPAVVVAVVVVAPLYFLPEFRSAFYFAAFFAILILFAFARNVTYCEVCGAVRQKNQPVVACRFCEEAGKDQG